MVNRFPPLEKKSTLVYIIFYIMIVYILLFHKSKNILIFKCKYPGVIMVYIKYSLKFFVPYDIRELYLEVLCSKFLVRE